MAMVTSIPENEGPLTKARVRAHFRDFVETGLAPFQAERYAADVAQSTMMEYLLPMLYGALGAFVFVVRLVTSDIDRGSLRMLLRIRYRIRLLLGAIFGLTVAMLTTEHVPFMKGIPLSAVALAFLVGYGIDGAFSLLDAVIGRARRMGLEQLSSRVPVAGAPPQPAAVAHT